MGDIHRKLRCSDWTERHLLTVDVQLEVVIVRHGDNVRASVREHQLSHHKVFHVGTSGVHVRLHVEFAGAISHSTSLVDSSRRVLLTDRTIVVDNRPCASRYSDGALARVADIHVDGTITVHTAVADDRSTYGFCSLTGRERHGTSDRLVVAAHLLDTDSTFTSTSRDDITTQPFPSRVITMSCDDPRHCDTTTVNTGIELNVERSCKRVGCGLEHVVVGDDKHTTALLNPLSDNRRAAACSVVNASVVCGHNDQQPVL